MWKTVGQTELPLVSHSAHSCMLCERAIETTWLCTEFLDYACFKLRGYAPEFIRRWINMNICKFTGCPLRIVVSVHHCDALYTGWKKNKNLSYGVTRYVNWNLVNRCTTVRKLTFQKACSRWITLKVTQGHRNCLYSMGHISILVCCL